MESVCCHMMEDLSVSWRSVSASDEWFYGMSGVQVIHPWLTAEMVKARVAIVSRL